jgi:hypothetical protein
MKKVNESGVEPAFVVKSTWNDSVLPGANPWLKSLKKLTGLAFKVTVEARLPLTLPPRLLGKPLGEPLLPKWKLLIVAALLEATPPEISSKSIPNGTV